jgi:hypothetical protein
MTVVFEEQSLWLVPAVSAIYFMLWVLWGWWREERRRDHAKGRVIRAELILPNASRANHARTLRFQR